MSVPYSSSKLTLRRDGMIVTVSGSVAVTSNFSGVTNQSVNETVPDEYRPEGSAAILLAGNNGQVWNIQCDSNGRCLLSGSAAIGYVYNAIGTWVVER